MTEKRHYLKLLVLLIMAIGLAIPQTVAQAQSAFEKRVTVRVRNIPAEDVFKSIRRQSGLNFFYSTDFAKTWPKLTLDIVNKPAIEAVAEVTNIMGCTFEQKGNIVNIMAQKHSGEKRKIRGRVTDADNQPLIGVPVCIGESRVCTVTDADGMYSIDIPVEKTTLKFTYVGMDTYYTVVQAGTKEVVRNVTMKSDTQLNEVVVTGIFTRRAESFTGSTTSFTREELFRVGSTNLLQSLKNLDPSFMMVEDLGNGSDPNSMGNFVVRGQSGLPDLRGEYNSNPNEPLFILDGFETTLTTVMDMDMNRIANVTILKDAAAKAIYGSKAANGVVVIETHRPESGKLRVSYTGKVTFSTPDLSSYDLANASEKLDVEKAGGLYDNVENFHEYDLKYNQRLENVLKGIDTDWMAQPVRTGVGHKHSLYIEGGDNRLTYGVEFTYNNVVGVMKGSERNTLSGGLTFSYRTGNFLFREQLLVNNNKANNSPYGAFSEYTSMNPYYSIHDKNGNIAKVLDSGIVGGTITNPLWNATINTIDQSKYTQLTNNLYIEYTTKFNLRATARLGVTYEDNGSEVFKPSSHTSFVSYTTEELLNRRGSYDYSDGESTSVNADVNANYSHAFGNHTLFSNIGWSLNTSKNRSLTFMTEGFPNDYLEDITFARQYAKDSRPSGSENTTHSMGFVGAFNYAYADRYLLDASYRLSGSSQFGADNRWGKFWSLGAGWNLHNEQFMKDLGFVDKLKLRASVGYSGSENFNSYQSRATYQYNTDYSYLNRYGAYLMGIENPSLRWQRKMDINYGTDIQLFNRRLTLKFDYYIANTDDLLTDVTVPSSTGFTSYKENLGEVQNKGYEIGLNCRVWQDSKRGNYLGVYANATHNTNKIRKISNALSTFNKEQAAEAGESDNNKPVVRYEEGQSLNAIWAVRSYGIDPASGKELYIKKDNSLTYDWSSDDLVVCGCTDPTLNGNFGFNFEYNGFRLNAGCTWKFGGELYNQTLVDKVENANLYKNVDRRVFSERWREPGDISLFKDIADASTTHATSRFVEKNNQLIFSSFNVSYDLARLIKINRIGLSRLRLSFDMNDIATWSSIKIERGTSYPYAREFSFSLQAMF